MGRYAVPAVRIFHILRHALTAFVETAKTELGLLNAFFRCLAKPFGRFFRIFFHPTPIRVHPRQEILRVGVVRGFREGDESPQGLVEITGDQRSHAVVKIGPYADGHQRGAEHKHCASHRLLIHSRYPLLDAVVVEACLTPLKQRFEGWPVQRTAS